VLRRVRNRSSPPLLLVREGSSIDNTLVCSPSISLNSVSDCRIATSISEITGIDHSPSNSAPILVTRNATSRRTYSEADPESRSSRIFAARNFGCAGMLKHLLVRCSVVFHQRKLKVSHRFSLRLLLLVDELAILWVNNTENTYLQERLDMFTSRFAMSTKSNRVSSHCEVISCELLNFLRMMQRSSVFFLSC
jgi:hypothetical protein